MEYMKPRKFYYYEGSVFGSSYLIEWKNDRLELRHPPFSNADCAELDTYVVPSDTSWLNFERNVRGLAIGPVNPNVDILDGTQVEAWITFRYRLVKFFTTNPEFKNFHQFRNLVNELTHCSKFPNGIFKSSFY